MSEAQQPPDPGGSKAPEVSDLIDHHELVLIGQLKEMLRKEQSTVSQDKLEGYMNSLTRARSKNFKLRRGTDESTGSGNVDANKRERVTLLKQQMEENKAKLAQRGKSQKGLEEMVSQLQLHLNSSTQLGNIETTSLDYNENTPQRELYKIILVKERKLTELAAKTQKLEHTVLDLQENLKEKDSVIDARTKAISLMTDSLSRKGKSTLDALEDTKNQMRQMQEDFVKLEEEMKQRQLLLLNDLKMKNFEIQQLQDSCNLPDQSTSEDVLALREEKAELAAQLEESKIERQQRVQELKAAKSESEELRSQLSSTTKHLDDGEEISKLKKQLDESNKNMIKLRANQKSKVKELTKKLDQFKNMSDANSVIAQLQNSVQQLDRKVIELEEEKRSLETKLSEASKEEKQATYVNQSDEEEIKQLKNQVNTLEQELVERDKVISILEGEVLNLKSELKQQNEEQVKVSRQVSSEMSSIDYEEQMEAQKSKLIADLEATTNQKLQLLEEVEDLKKDRTELNAKLESYIQENMELIDKLEKLSAEKVSSVESIEIVEGLTQQEKLELEKYNQQQQNPDDHLMIESSEAPIELNETVLQLNEDTAELLQKIELFAMERKEVMSKMELLKEENNQLSARVTELDNTKAILEETYEQLQNQKEVVEQQLGEALENNHNLEAKLNETLEEVNNYQLTIEDNKTELVSAAETINKLQGDLEERQEDVEEFKIQIGELSNVVSELQVKGDNIEAAEAELESIKSQLLQSNQEESKELKEFKDQLRIQENDLTNKDERIQSLLEAMEEKDRTIRTFEDLKARYVQLETKLASNQQLLQQRIMELSEKNQEQLDKMKKLAANLKKKSQQCHKLEEEKEQFASATEKWETETKEKDVIIQTLQSQLASIVDVQVDETELKQLKSEIQQLQDTISKLEAANSNLSNQVQQKVETESKLVEETARCNDLTNQLHSQEILVKKLKVKVKKLQEKAASEPVAVKEDESKIEEIEADWKHKYDALSQEVSQLTRANSDLEAEKVDLVNQLVQLQEFNAEVSLEDEMKLSADDRKQIEQQLHSVEAELSRRNIENDQLQEQLCQLQEINNSLDSTNLNLREGLQQASLDIEAHIQQQNQLDETLTQLNGRNIELSQQLQDLTAEQEASTSKLQQQENLVKKLKVKLKASHDKVQELSEVQQRFTEAEVEIQNLRQHIVSLEQNQRHFQSEAEQRNLSDYEKIEADFEDLLRQKNALVLENEKLNEYVEELKAELETSRTYHMQLNEVYEVANRKIQQLDDEIKYLKQELDSVEEERKIFNDSVEEVENLRKHIDGLQTQQRQSVPVFSGFVSQPDSGSETQAFKTAEQDTENLNAQIEETRTEVPLFSVFVQSEQQSTEALKVEIAALNSVMEDLKTREQKVSAELKIKNDEIADLKSQIESVNSESLEVKSELKRVLEEVATVNKKIEKEHSSEIQIKERLQSALEEKEKLLIEIAELNTQVQQLKNEETQAQPILNEDRSDLLKKIEALQFLLYNADKEKDLAVEECSHLVKELHQLIYQHPHLVEAQDQAASSPFDRELESQIESNIQPASSEALQSTEFTPTNPYQGESSNPVAEPLVKSKEAYLCYDKDNEKPTLEDDDGWAWGPEELEKQTLQDLKNTVKVLQVEREAHLEEIKQLKVKSGKLIKKCKELKAQAVDGGFMNEAIEEELKNQTEQLEKRVKETTQELEKERTEKERLLKKVEVLGSANDRMVEMKDIQDAEVHRWQRKYEDLLQQQNQDDWTDFGHSTAAVPSTDERVTELEKTITDLTLDNEELQALLEERRGQNPQTDHSAQLQGALQQLEVANDDKVKLQSQLRMLEQEILQLQDGVEAAELQVKELNDNKVKLEADLETKNTHFIELQQQIERLLTEKQQLLNQIAQLEISVNQLQNELDSNLQQFDIVTIENRQLQQHVNELQQTSIKLQAELDLNVLQISELTNEKIQLQESLKQQVNQVNEPPQLQSFFRFNQQSHPDLDQIHDTERLQQQLDALTQEKIQLQESLELQVQSLQREIESHLKIIHDITSEGGELQGSISHLQETIKQLQTELDLKVETENQLRSQLHEVTERNNQSNSLQLQNVFDVPSQIELDFSQIQEVERLRHQLDVTQQDNFELQESLTQLRAELNLKVEIENRLRCQLEEETKKNIPPNSTQLQTFFAVPSQIEPDLTQIQEVEKLRHQLDTVSQQNIELQLSLSQLQSKEHSNVDQNPVFDMFAKDRRITAVETSIQPEVNFFTFGSNPQTASQIETDIGVLAQPETLPINFQVNLDRLQEVESQIGELKQQLQIETDRKTKAEDEVVWLKLKTESDADIVKNLEEKIKLLEIQLSDNVEAEAHLEKCMHLETQLQLQIDAFNRIESERHQFEETISNLNETWQVAVDQRGADVAESWKQHMELVDKEFAVEREQLNLRVTGLEQKCQHLQSQLDSTAQDGDVKELHQRLMNVNAVIEITQRQLDEKREVVDEIIKILEQNAPAPISFEKDDILKEFNRQLQFTNSETIEDLQRVVGEKTREITGLQQIIEDLEREVGVIHQKDAELARLAAEINQLQAETQQLRFEKHEVENLLNVVAANLESEKVAKMAMETQLIELQKLKVQLSVNQEVDIQLKKLQADYELLLKDNESEKDAKLALEAQLQRLLQDIQHLNVQLYESQQIYAQLQMEKQQIEVELSTIKDSVVEFENLRKAKSDLEIQLQQQHQDILNLNDRILTLTDNREVDALSKELADSKEDYLTLQTSFAECQRELFEAKIALENKSEELQDAVLESRKKLEQDIHAHYEQIVATREAHMRQQIEELVASNQSCSERLNQEITQRSQLEVQLHERSQLVDEDTKQLEELKLIIEDQVAKIEELKEELFEKSNQFDSLIAQMDVGRVPPVTRQPYPGGEDLTDPVNRAELDLALYMLHQRDVKCEELTVELTQLLEERDTLQLRLSNALREKEELTRAEPSSIDESSQHTLATKLSELKTVGYKKDKTFMDEQELRNLQQMSLMQQHIQDAAKLPPEAAAKLVDASYTLSRDVQSPSKVLLNWLWGKNPPKARDDDSVSS